MQRLWLAAASICLLVAVIFSCSGAAPIPLILHLVASGLLLVGLWLAIPSQPPVPEWTEPLLELSGLWPVNWLSPRRLQENLLSIVLFGIFPGLLLAEAALRVSETSPGWGGWLLVVDVITFTSVTLITLWLVREYYGRLSPRLFVTRSGLALLDYPDRRIPGWIPWVHLKRVAIEILPLRNEFERRRQKVLRLWYAPRRTVFEAGLPAGIAPEDLSRFDELVAEFHGEDEPPPVQEAPAAPREFHRLLQRLTQSSPQQGGLLQPEEPPVILELTPEDYLVDIEQEAGSLPAQERPEEPGPHSG